MTGWELPVPQIALPVGISFFTFQAMSYVIDVYRGEVQPQKNFMYVLLYISLFPQLIAGPIVKYHDVEKELVNRRFCVQEAAKGIRRFIGGLGKKVLIANYMGEIADTLFTAPMEQINIFGAWLGAAANTAWDRCLDFILRKTSGILMEPYRSGTFGEDGIFLYPDGFGNICISPWAAIGKACQNLHE